MKIELNRDQIKYIAIFTMLLNHIANIFLTPETFACEALKDIGYFTAPVMCWFLVEGYRYTRSVKKYAKRLLIFAVLSQPPYYLAFARNGLVPWYTLNMMFTLFLCLCLVSAEEKVADPERKNLIRVGIVVVSMICDWAVLAPLYTFLFYYAGRDPVWQKKAFFVASFVLWVTVAAELPGANGVMAGIGAMMAVLAAGVCIQVFYNGEKSQKYSLVKKYFFYVFYPAHLVILALLKI